MITALFKQVQGTHRSLELHSWPNMVAILDGGDLGERGPEDLERCPRPVPVDESNGGADRTLRVTPPGASSGLKGGPSSTGGQACTQPDTVTPQQEEGPLGPQWMRVPARNPVPTRSPEPSQKGCIPE